MVKNKEKPRKDLNLNQHIHEIVEYYRSHGAPNDQQMLIVLLKEVQDVCGGMLSQCALDAVADALSIRPPIIQALIRRIPSLKCESVAHRLEICGTCKKGAALQNHIEETYKLRSGGVHEQYKYSYRVTGCMKNCKCGPSVRWDGVLQPSATIELLEKLIHA